MSRPQVPGATALLRPKGAERMVCLAWFICTGILVDRLHAGCARFAEATGIEVLPGAPRTPPGLVPLVLARHDGAFEGDIQLNCETRAYRQPFPGLRGRVGQPVGQGHSHLADEHRVHRHHRLDTGASAGYPQAAQRPKMAKW